MGYLSERFNYLRGLSDGLDLSNDTKETKLILGLIELLDDVVLAVEDLEDSRDEMNNMLDEIDEDLGELECAVYGDECDCCDDEEYAIEVECPECNSLIKLTEDLIDEEDDSFICPSCGKKVEIEWSCDCDEECDEDCKH